MQTALEVLSVLMVGVTVTVNASVNAALDTESSPAERSGWRAVRHDVLVVPDVGVGLVTVERRRPDVVLLDLGPDEEAGLAELVQWHRVRPDIPILLISEDADDALAVRAIQAGAVDYLSVPSLGALLPRALQLAVERNRASLELNRLASDLIGIVSHDLRGPTSNIIGYVELMVSHEGTAAPSGAHAKMLGRILQNATFIMSLIGDLLTTVRIDSGKVQLALEPHDVDALLREVVDRCSFLADGKSITLRTTCSPSPAHAVVDRLKVLQILNNLVSNAIKFSSEGSEVVIGAERSLGQLSLWVEDHGQGIKPDEVPNLFQKFSLTSTRATRGERGSGLGLFIVSEFVKLHRGSWGVESTPGKGSTFTVKLPQHDETSAVRPFVAGLQQGGVCD